MREIGLIHSIKSEISAAINVLIGNVELFPLSNQTNYWLGIAVRWQFEENL